MYCSILKYADDIRIYLSVPKSQDALADLHWKIQHDINSIATWANDSGMTFNIDKCFYATFGTYADSDTRSYKINDDAILTSSCFGDLGVTVSTPLSFNKHIDHVVAKCFSRLSLINKVFRIRSKHSLLRLYKCMVRPLLDYASITWNPYTVGNILRVERVQKRACRLIPSMCHLHYREQLAELGMLSLRARRIRYQLITIFKMYKKGELGNFFVLRNNKKIRGHSATLQIKYAKNNYRRYFFTIAAIDLWNKLPQNSIDLSLTTFKIHLIEFLAEQGIF